jgi:hypothetical protein
VAEHQLDDADVHAVGQEPAGAFVPKVMPAEIDLFELLAVPRRALPAGPWLDAVSQ